MAIVNFAWISTCVKAGLPDDSDYPDSVSMSLEAVAYGNTSASTFSS